MSDLHAVRWARRKVRREWDYTRWHGTNDSNITFCGRLIPIAIEGGTFLPDTGDLADVDCQLCNEVMQAKGQRKEKYDDTRGI